MLFLTSFIWIILTLQTTFLINSILGSKCVDTTDWHDKINNSTCSDYVVHGWCVNRTLASAMKVHSIPSLNFPELNCCGCGKKESLNLSPTAQWAENATTVAGSANGTQGSSLNMLNLPTGITIDDDNTLYIADTGNHRVVLASLNSIIRTVDTRQGSQPYTLMVDGVLGIYVTRTSIYITDSLNCRVQQWPKNLTNPMTVAGVAGVSGNPTSITTISQSHGLFVDSYANIFVSDTDNHRVMAFPWYSTSGTSGAIVAGTGFEGLGADELRAPFNVFVDHHRLLYIADFANHRIQRWILGASEGVTVAGTGVAGDSLSQLHFPTAVLVDLNQYMYISDGNNPRIMRWALGAHAGECIAGCSGRIGNAANQLYSPYSIAFDSSGSLYVTDSGNHRVQKFQILDETTLSTTQSWPMIASKVAFIKPEVSIISIMITFVWIILQYQVEYQSEQNLEQ